MQTDKQTGKRADMETGRQTGRQAVNNAVNYFTWPLSESLRSHLSRSSTEVLLLCFVRPRKSFTSEVQRFNAAIFHMTHSESFKLMYKSSSP